MVECLDLRPDQPRPQGAFSLALEVGREKGCLRADVSYEIGDVCTQARRRDMPHENFDVDEPQ